MTREEVLGMEAGRELDQLVAEKIMEIDLIRMVHPDEYVTMEMAIDAGDRSLAGSLYRQAEFEQIEPPPFSTSIEAAWEVVKKLKNDFIFDLSFSDKWCCQFLKFHEEIGEVDEYIATSETAPEAIVKAALLAVMEGENEN